MNLIDYLRTSVKPTVAQFGQLQRFFQMLLSACLEPVVPFVTEELPTDLATRISTPPNDETLASISEQLAQLRKVEPGLTLADMIGTMHLADPIGVLCVVDAVNKRCPNGLVTSIIEPIKPVLTSMDLWGWVQVGSRAIQSPTVQGQIVILRLDDILKPVLDARRAALTIPTPTGPPHIIVGPYQGPG